jgi:DNA-binding response OmpR family regulator
MWNKDLVLNHGNDKCVLAIDDEYDIVNLIKLSLEVDGFKVSAFTDPIVALVHLCCIQKIMV